MVFSVSPYNSRNGQHVSKTGHSIYFLVFQRFYILRFSKCWWQCHIHCTNITFVIFDYPGIFKVHDVSETGSASCIRSEEGKDPTLLGLLKDLVSIIRRVTHSYFSYWTVSNTSIFIIIYSVNYVSILSCIRFTCFFPIELIFCISAYSQLAVDSYFFFILYVL
jgi:hypothetical protein